MAYTTTLPTTAQALETGVMPSIRANILAIAMMLEPTDAGEVASPVAGLRRFNASSGLFERFSGVAWTEQTTAYLKSATAAATYLGINATAAAATKLATARTINGVAFDGTASITIADATKLPLSGGTINGGIAVTSLTTQAANPTQTKLFVNSPADQSAAIVRVLIAGGDLFSITAAGIVAIGATPASGATSNLQTGGDISLFGATASSLMFNAYYAGGWKTRNAGYSGAIRFQQADGAVQILASATAAAANDGTSDIGEVARFTPAGVGIGTQAPARKLDVSGAARTAPVSLAYAATVTLDAAASNAFIVGTLTGNVMSMSINNPVEGQFLSIRFRQDGTGGRTVALPAGAKVAGSIASGANRTSYLSLTYNAVDTRWEGSWTQIPA